MDQGLSADIIEEGIVLPCLRVLIAFANSRACRHVDNARLYLIVLQLIGVSGMQARALSSPVIIALVDLATAMVRIASTGKKTAANELFHGLNLYHQRLVTFLPEKRVLQHV